MIKNNKFRFIADIKAEEKYKNLAKKVRYEIDKRLKYINCFSLMQDTDSLIFGGAVRDAIAGLEIHDIDIVVLPQAFRIISERLLQYDFKKIEKYSIDIVSLYNGITQIHEPVNWFKEDVFIQFIRPRKIICEGENPKTYLYDFISNVDISCCAVSFFPNETLIEHFPDAIHQCLSRTFNIVETSTLYNSNRILMRLEKLKDRGWTEKEQLKTKCSDCVHNKRNIECHQCHNFDRYEEDLPF
jgi:hypothetical protein